ncbi:MAG: chitobiase/beta-hexosaminidase C-terminal domain-containing protein [Candidatus Bathyarchaeia archaeon]|jgi:hypothetical protein
MRIQREKTLTLIIIVLFLTATLSVSITIPPAHADYSVTIQAWDSVAGWQTEPIGVNGFYNTGYTTPHTFTLSEGETVTFSVPSTDSVGTPFTHWDTGETTLDISVSSAGTYTAQYYVPYSVTIQAYDNVAGWQSVPIQLDGVDQYVNTTYTFTDMTGTNTFAVPGTDNAGGSFTQWNTGETTPTITVSSGGTYTAQYYQYYFTIQAWDTVAGMQTGLPVDEDAYWWPVGYTPYTNATSGTHTFEVPPTDNAGTAFSQWDTGETTRYITVSSQGVYTAQYWAPYDVTIQAWDSVAGSLSEPISMGGSDTGFSTPHTFTVAEGETHTFTVPSTDSVGTPFTQWDTGETSPTLSVIAAGAYTAQYEVLYIFKVATPTFSPPAGTYASSQSVTVSCATSGATITYTVDGSEPTSSSTAYSSPVSVSVTTTIKAKAFNSGMTDSDTASATYTINIPPGKVATPTFSPSAGTYTSSQSVTVSCATSGATIRYTADGSEPTSSSTVYSSPVSVSVTTTIKAKAFMSGMTDSDTASATYTINIPVKVATPTFSPPAGTYSSAQSVTVRCDTSGATIGYTTDGSEPSSASTVYSGPILVDSGTLTVKAEAFKSGMTDSDTATATYTINPQQVSTPNLSPAGSSYSSAQSVTISCATSEATIRYTVDGSEPTSSSTVYSIPISVSSGTVTVKAKAFKDGMIDSDTASATYTISVEPAKVAAPTMSPPGGTYSSTQNVALSCDTEGATIRFTVDGSVPTSSSTAYSGSISVGSTTTIKAKAFKSGLTDSDTASATYTINIPPGKVATPMFSPPGGTYSASRSVALSCSTNDATIRYTVDGSEPSSTSTVYSSPVSVSVTTTIKAKAFNSGMTDSDTGSATYTINTSPDFSVSASPASQSVSQGQSTTYTVTVTSVGGFSAGVSLTVTGLPTGATSAFSPSTVTPTGTSTLTVATAGRSPVGTVTLTITGTSGSLTHSATVSLVVSASPSLSSPMVPLWVLAAVIGGVLIVTLAAVIAYRSSKGRKKTLGPTPTPPPPPPPPPPRS